MATLIPQACQAQETASTVHSNKANCSEIPLYLIKNHYLLSRNHVLFEVFQSTPLQPLGRGGSRLGKYRGLSACSNGGGVFVSITLIISFRITHFLPGSFHENQERTGKQTFLPLQNSRIAQQVVVLGSFGSAQRWLA